MITFYQLQGFVQILNLTIKILKLYVGSTWLIVDVSTQINILACLDVHTQRGSHSSNE